VSPAAAVEPIEMPFGLRTQVGPMNHVLGRGPDPSMGTDNFDQEGRPIVKYRDTAVSYAKTAEPIEMPFGLWAQVGPRKHVLEGGPDPHAKRQFLGERTCPGMATNETLT